MEEIELKSFVQALILRNKGYKFKHIKTGNIYTLIAKIKSKNPLICGMQLVCQNLKLVIVFI